MKLIKLIEKTLNHNCYKILINHFFEEVVDDIKTLKGENPCNNNLDQIIKGLSWENEELEIKTKERTAKKYKERYCPNSLFDYFTPSEKLNYLILRNKIDKILKIKDAYCEI